MLKLQYSKSVVHLTVFIQEHFGEYQIDLTKVRAELKQAETFHVRLRRRNYVLID